MLEKAANASATRVGTKIEELDTTVQSMQFGKVVGPNDDVAAAVKGLGATGGTVFLRRGVYAMKEPIVLGSGVTLVGEVSAAELSTLLRHDLLLGCFLDAFRAMHARARVCICVCV